MTSFSNTRFCLKTVSFSNELPAHGKPLFPSPDRRHINLTATPTPPFSSPSPYPSVRHKVQRVYGTLDLLQLLQGVSIPLDGRNRLRLSRHFHKVENIKAVTGYHRSPCLPFINAARYTDTCSVLFCALLDCHSLAFADDSPDSHVCLLPAGVRAQLQWPPQK